MLKAYYPQESAKVSKVDTALLRPVAADCTALFVTSSPDPSTDEFLLCSTTSHGAQLPNSEMLNALPSLLDHLSPQAAADVIDLIGRFPCLFGDVPTRTNVLKHDIDVNDAKLIKQHAYHVNPTKHALMKKETEYLLQNGLARPSSSPWFRLVF